MSQLHNELGCRHRNNCTHPHTASTVTDIQLGVLEILEYWYWHNMCLIHIHLCIHQGIPEVRQTSFSISQAHTILLHILLQQFLSFYYNMSHTSEFENMGWHQDNPQTQQVCMYVPDTVHSYPHCNHSNTLLHNKLKHSVIAPDQPTHTRIICICKHVLESSLGDDTVWIWLYILMHSTHLTWIYKMWVQWVKLQLRIHQDIPIGKGLMWEYLASTCGRWSLSKQMYCQLVILKHNCSHTATWLMCAFNWNARSTVLTWNWGEAS